LELFLLARAAGRSHRELRAFVPTAWDLAQKVTHGDVDRVDTYAAAQATVLLVRVLQQLAPVTSSSLSPHPAEPRPATTDVSVLDASVAAALRASLAPNTWRAYAADGGTGRGGRPNMT